MATWEITRFADETIQVLYTNPATDTFRLPCGQTPEGFPMGDVIGFCASEGAPFDMLVVGTLVLVVFPAAEA